MNLSALDFCVRIQAIPPLYSRGLNALTGDSTCKGLDGERPFRGVLADDCVPLPDRWSWKDTLTVIQLMRTTKRWFRMSRASYRDKT